MRPKSTFVFYDKKGIRHEFDWEKSQVIVILNEPFWCAGKQYNIGDEIVIPKSVAKIIDCVIIGDWEVR